MLPIKILDSTANSILYEIPPGKPDPYQQCISRIENRERVLRSATKGETCWYYAFNLIRERIGKKPVEEKLNARSIERICSLRRKLLTQLWNDLSWNELSFLNLKSAKNILEDLKDTTNCDFIHSIKKDKQVVKLISLIQKFILNDVFDNFSDFLENEKFKGYININYNFINIFDSFEKEMLTKLNKNETLYYQWGKLDALARALSVKLFNLKPSAWSPCKGIDSLVNELKNNGPLAIGGRFGRACVLGDCTKKNEKICDRDIYTWEEINLDSGPKHFVLLVGAKKINDSGFVYFIDPNDPSDPTEFSQPIYEIQFSNLTENITKDAYGYGYHGKFAIEDLDYPRKEKTNTLSVKEGKEEEILDEDTNCRCNKYIMF